MRFPGSPVEIIKILTQSTILPAAHPADLCAFFHIVPSGLFTQVDHCTDTRPGQNSLEPKAINTNFNSAVEVDYYFFPEGRPGFLGL